MFKKMFDDVCMGELIKYLQLGMNDEIFNSQKCHALSLNINLFLEYFLKEIEWMTISLINFYKTGKIIDQTFTCQISDTMDKDYTYSISISISVSIAMQV